MIEFGRAVLGLIARAKVWAEPRPEADLVAAEPPPQVKVPQRAPKSGCLGRIDSESNRLGVESIRSILS